MKRLVFSSDWYPVGTPPGTLFVSRLREQGVGGQRVLKAKRDLRNLRLVWVVCCKSFRLHSFLAF